MGKTEYPFGRLGYEVRKAIKNDLDAKILITSHNSKPGLGKTTLAILMARAWDPKGWAAEEKAFMDVYEYKNYYMDGEPGSVLVFDELEGEADRRRAMSHKNVDLSQAWAQLRYRNMVSIATLPSVSMLDSRMLEMSDYWINVVSRGVALPHYVQVNDYTGKVWREQMGRDNDMVIRYPDLSSGDDDYLYLKNLKDERNRTDRQWVSGEEVDRLIREDREEALREQRDEFIRELHASTSMSYERIAALDAVDVSKDRVGQICRSASL